MMLAAAASGNRKGSHAVDRVFLDGAWLARSGENPGPGDLDVVVVHDGLVPAVVRTGGCGD